MGKLLILTGPSTSGKTTLLEYLGIRPLVTVTTRPMRPGEIQGIHYHFLTEEEYDYYDSIGELPEKTVYAGVRYGIFKKDIEAVLTGEDHGVVLDVVGLNFMRDYLGNDNVKAVYIGVSPKTMAKRLQERGSSPDEINRRVQQAIEKELTPEYRSVCDAEIWNDGSLFDTLNQLESLLHQWGFQVGKVVQ